MVGEGAGILVIEELEFAQARGAKILAEVVGYGMSADAFHVTSPPADGDGAFRVMRNAMKDARSGTRSRSITSTRTARPPMWATGPRPWRSSVRSATTPIKVAVSSTKIMTGHLLGGAGGLEAGITVLAIRDQVAPPTVNYECPDPDCDLDYVPNHARPMKIDHALSNSFGFGGTNGCLIFKRYVGIEAESLPSEPPP